MSPRWDITVEPGIFEKRGAYASIGGRLAHPRGRSEATVFYHADRKIKGDAEALTRNPDDYSTNRWYATGRVTEDFGRGYVGKARIDLAGDDRYNFDYGPSILERSRPEYENNIFVERRDGIIGLIAGTTYYQDLRIVGSTGIDGPAPYNSAPVSLGMPSTFTARAPTASSAAGGQSSCGLEGTSSTASMIFW